MSAAAATTSFAAVIALAGSLASFGPVRDQAAGHDVIIFAAASLQTALDALAPQIEQATGVRVKASYAASSALAKQIENGAPADIFISADLEWMDYAAARHLIEPSSRVNLLGNQLVLVSPTTNSTSLTIAPGFPLGRALGSGRLAVADPVAVPAGKYAKAALTSLGVWDSVADRLASAENVRAALLLVSRGEVPFGIVYRSDAHADPGVRIVDSFPESSHPPIVYPIALTTWAKPAAAKVLAFLKTAPAKGVFEKEGFTTNPK